MNVRQIVIKHVKMMKLMYIWFKNHEIVLYLFDFFVYFVIFVCFDLFCLILLYDVYSTLCEKIYVSCRYTLG